MEFALITMAVLLVVVGARGTYKEVGALLGNEFSGAHNFFIWIAAIGVVGSIGYVPALQKFSRLFLALIIIAMVLSEQGFFAQFLSSLQSIAGNSGGGAASSAGSVLTTGAASGSASGTTAPLASTLNGAVQSVPQPGNGTIFTPLTITPGQ